MKKYIVWVNYGYEGWQKNECDTLEDMLKIESYGSEKVFTKLLSIGLSEVE